MVDFCPVTTAIILSNAFVVSVFSSFVRIPVHFVVTLNFLDKLFATPISTAAFARLRAVLNIGGVVSIASHIVKLLAIGHVADNGSRVSVVRVV
jgi:hypothetical protein